ncbi:MAG: dihydroorotate dehydrogenase-like protein [candidate division KSB1 bacterium]|jgi:dihydroorotate dehydrogenase (fumarate)|nr:dihydroorotate dehydrogenase-like protein [candidate division KSB1 bacterium]
MDLSTTYMGLTLRNPFIVASSGMTKTADQIKKAEDAGAGAVVMKSLFEEQIREESSSIGDQSMVHTEAMEYLRAEIDMLYGPREYIETIKKAKKEVDIPVIASVNCFSSKWWTDYAQQLEAAGADALELNVYVLPFDIDKGSYDLENTYIDILQAVMDRVDIPVSMKLSPYFTSFGNFADKLDKHGADGLVLFNRFIQPEVNIHAISSSVKPLFDDPIGFTHALRWVALLSDRLNLDIVASGNIRTADDAIKQLLAGATAVQFASILYKKGLDVIGTMIDGLTKWMTEKEFSTLDDFRGKLNEINDPHSVSFVRAQFIKTITGIE